MKPRWIPFTLATTLVGCTLYTPVPPTTAELRLVGNQPTPFYQALEGEWQVQTPLPNWLSVSRQQGQGDIAFEVQARGADGCAAQSADVTVRWNKTLTGVGSTLLRVRYTPSGPRSASLETRTPDLGVIVRYKSAAGARKALARTSAVGGSESSRRVLVQGVPLEQLRSDPEVESASPNVPLQPIYGASVVSSSGAVTPARAALGALAIPESVTPTDQYYPLQWGLRDLGYPQVWGSLKTRSDLKPTLVAVLDGGIRYDHPDLSGHLVSPEEGALDLVGLTPDSGDGFGPDTDPTDPSAPVSSNSACTSSRLLNSSHGTHVAGIVVAGTGEFTRPCPACSSSGVVGAALFAPIKVLPIRVISMRDEADSFGVSTAIRYAAGQSVSFGGKSYTNPLADQTRVINLSLGGALNPDSESARELCSAVTFARSRGVLTVAAAGNRPEAVLFPAACPDAVAVASLGLENAEQRFVRAPYSAKGPQLALSAPGGDTSKSFNGGTLNGQPFRDAIFSTDWDYLKNEPKYEGKEGTSQASPQVAALAALIFSSGLESTPQGVLERMQRTALDLGAAGRDEEYGHGAIQPLEALEIPR